MMRLPLFCFLFLFATSTLSLAQDSKPVAKAKVVPKVQTIVPELVQILVKLQDKRGLWAYEGRYRVDGEIPVTYEVGGTAIVCLGLLYGAAETDRPAQDALMRGIQAILERLDDPRMRPSRKLEYDMRVLAQAYALLLFCHLEDKRAAGKFAKKVKHWIPVLANALAHEQLRDGGWNYQGRSVQAAFVTASVVQALLWAQKPGLLPASKTADLRKSTLVRARKALVASQAGRGAFFYFGTSKGKRSPPQADRPAGSAGRSAICETMLFLLGAGSEDRIRDSIHAFRRHWLELKKRHQKPDTHKGPHLIAPYYFYYGHRYAAQAIEFLPKPERAKQRERLRQLIGRSRDKDGTFNDRVFPQARCYGTAMVLLSLLGEKVTLPPRLDIKRSSGTRRL